LPMLDEKCKQMLQQNPHHHSDFQVVYICLEPLSGCPGPLHERTC
jgi:hypothetical protein